MKDLGVGLFVVGLVILSFSKIVRRRYGFGREFWGALALGFFLIMAGGMIAAGRY